MKFPSLKSGKTTCVQVEGLSGGCNLRDGAQHVDDRQLEQVTNMWWKNGALRTRPFFAGEKKNQHYTVKKDKVIWRFFGEDTVKNGQNGRRFIRTTGSGDSKQMALGFLGYDGTYDVELVYDDFYNSAVVTAVEYPYSETENVLLYTDSTVYAQDGEYHRSYRDIRDEIYVPCVTIDGQGEADLSTPPSHPGVAYESFNLLTEMFSARFTTTETGAVFYLPYKDLSDGRAVTISITQLSGEVVTYTIPAGSNTCAASADGLKPYADRKKGIVYFMNAGGAYAAPAPGVANNMCVTATRLRDETRRRMIASTTLSTWYGGTDAGCDSRLFLSGSKYAPNRIYWSEKGQPLYFPEDNYIAVGDVNQAVTAFGKQDGLLLIFKEREIYSLGPSNTLVSDNVTDGKLATAMTAKSEYFPLTQVSGHIGCTVPRTLVMCDNYLCWADGRGSVYTLLKTTAGHVLRELSGFISPRLRAVTAEGWDRASAALYQGHYVLHIDGVAYVLRIDEKAFKQYDAAYTDSKTGKHLTWFVWEFPDEYTLFHICGNGHAAIGIAQKDGTDKQGNAVVYENVLRLCEGADAPDETYFEDWRKTACGFATKVYTCGELSARKRVMRVYLGMETDTDATVRFSYCHNGEKRCEIHEITGETAGEVVLTPNLARTRHFGVAMQAEGCVAVDSLAFSYR